MTKFSDLKDKYDVLIAGGGPAGSSMGNYLSQAGLKVCILEKDKFPRHHVGESLLPFCYDLFEEMGVMKEMKKRFLRKPGAIFSNHDSSVETTYCFRNVVETPKHLSFHVRRAEFDQLLLNHSQKQGADVIEETKVKNVEIDDDKVEAHIIHKDETKKITASFFVDATGREGLLAKQNNWRVPMEDLDRIAFHSYWNYEEIPWAVKQGMIRIVYLEGEKKGWIWCIPVDEKRISIGVVVDHAYFKKQSQKEEEGKRIAKNEFYELELKDSTYIRELIEGAKRDEEVHVNGNYSYRSRQKFGKRFAMVGDSGQFIDPIFSSGVFIAMKSSQLVSKVIPAYLENFDLGLLESTYKTIANGYETVEELIALYYNPSLLNFSDMGDIDQNEGSKDFIDFKNGYTLLHYLLAGDFFERGHIYKEFFRSLRNEKTFKRWQSLVKWDQQESGVHYNKMEDCGENLH